MDQSSGRMTSRSFHLDELASPDEDSEDELLSDTYESSEEYSILKLDKSSSEPMWIDRVRLLVASLSPNIPTYKWIMKAKILLHFLHVQANKKKKKEKRKGKWKREKIVQWIIPRKQMSNKTDEAKIQTKLKIDDWALGLRWKFFRIIRIITSLGYL